VGREGSRNPSLHKNLTNGKFPLASQNKQRTVVISERRRKVSEGDTTKIKKIKKGDGIIVETDLRGRRPIPGDVRKNRDDDQFDHNEGVPQRPSGHGRRRFQDVGGIPS